MKCKKRYSGVLITITLILLLSISLFIDHIVSMTSNNELITLITGIGTKVLIYLIVGKIFGINYKEVFTKKASKKYSIFFIIISPLYLLIEFVIRLLTQNVTSNTMYSFLGSVHFNIYFSLIQMVLYTIIIAPFFEEVVFRGYILKNSIERGTSPLKASIISSLLFGLYHLGIAVSINAFIYGMVSSYIYIKFKNIRYNIIFHRSINIITLILLVISLVK